jgi:arginyl-tRNA synthetase
MKTFKEKIAARVAKLELQDSAGVQRVVGELPGLSAPKIAEAIGAPPKPKPGEAERGELAYPCFQLAKALKKAPPVIAKELAERLNVIDQGDLGARIAAGEHSDSWASGEEGVQAYEAAGPYLNMRLNVAAMVEEVAAMARRAAAGRSNAAEANAGKVATIDFSSPNIAKQFSVPHLRSTATGWSLKRILEFQGWRVEGVNHLGDWGTQFGLLIDAFRRHGDEAALEADPIPYLHELYVAASAEAEANADAKDRARAAFVELEQGGADATALWKRFRDLSLREFGRIYEMLGVSFDHYQGESFYNDKMEPLFARLKAAGVARLDDGAWVIDTDGAGGVQAPLLLRKSDGASTYGMRDMAAVEYRHKAFRFDLNGYVTDGRQGPHFAQVFAAYAKLGADEAAAAAKCAHVPFGTVKIDGKIGSSRKGTILLLDAYLRELAENVVKLIDEKNPALEGKEEVALQIAIGAVVFEMLKRERKNDVHFSSEESIKTEGETGPRTQYLHARLSSLGREFSAQFGGRSLPAATGEADPLFVASPEAKAMFAAALRFEEAVERAAAELAPHHVAQYLLELVDAYNVFYREVRLIEPLDEAGSARRVAAMESLRAIVNRALSLLGMPAPERM